MCSTTVAVIGHHDYQVSSVKPVNKRLLLWKAKQRTLFNFNLFFHLHFCSFLSVFLRSSTSVAYPKRFVCFCLLPPFNNQLLIKPPLLWRLSGQHDLELRPPQFFRYCPCRSRASGSPNLGQWLILWRTAVVFVYTACPFERLTRKHCGCRCGSRVDRAVSAN